MPETGGSTAHTIDTAGGNFAGRDLSVINPSEARTADVYAAVLKTNEAVTLISNDVAVLKSTILGGEGHDGVVRQVQRNTSSIGSIRATLAVLIAVFIVQVMLLAWTISMVIP